MAAASSDAPTEVAVELSEFAITPTSIEIGAGGALQVTNGGVADHDFAVVDTDLATPMLSSGESAELDVSSLARVPTTSSAACRATSRAA